MARVAYADPPYVGQAKRYYNCEEIDYRALIMDLQTYDIWALSCSSPSLCYLLPVCPKEVRIAAWVKPFSFFKKGVNPGYCWEPILFYGARSAKQRGYQKTVRDWISCNTFGTTKAERESTAIKGRKPDLFCFFLFDLLGLETSDEFYDLFPGSGAVTRAWTTWRTSKQQAMGPLAQ